MSIFFFNDGRVGVHLTKDSKQGFVKPVDRVKGIRKHDTADYRAGDITFVPLIASEV